MPTTPSASVQHATASSVGLSRSVACHACSSDVCTSSERWTVSRPRRLHLQLGKCAASRARAGSLQELNSSADGLLCRLGIKQNELLIGMAPSSIACPRRLIRPPSSPRGHHILCMLRLRCRLAANASALQPLPHFVNVGAPRRRHSVLQRAEVPHLAAHHNAEQS